MEELLIPGTVLEGLGTGEDVPVYLRYEGQIRNINIGRKAIVELAHEICTAKAAHEVSGQLIGSQSPGALPTSKKLSKAARAAARNGVDASAAGCAGAEGDSDSDLDSVNSRTSHGRPGSSVGFHSPFLRPLSPELAALSAHGLAMNASDSYVPLLPSLPPTASMAEFFCCFLKVFKSA